MKVVGVIPVRLGSTRLAEKALKPLLGRPMIQRVWERASAASRLDDLMIACDDEKILECAKSFGARAEMTRQDHPNGSSRVAEIATRTQADVFLNIQGDEPLIHPESIDQLARVFEEDASLQVATLAVKRHDREGLEDPNLVKVVCNNEGKALYFSRAPIPFNRDSTSGPVNYWKHLGLYGYRKAFLEVFVQWPVGRLEEIEKLEQLRILEKNISIHVVETPHDCVSVDTAEDLDCVEALLREGDNSKAGS